MRAKLGTEIVLENLNNFLHLLGIVNGLIIDNSYDFFSLRS